MVVTDKLLTERFRPKSLKYVAMPDRVRSQISKFVDGNMSQNVLLYSSTPGTGKTTITRILSAPYGPNCKVINASKERGIDVIRDTIINFSSSFSILGGETVHKLIVLEEMDGLTRESFDALRAIMEDQADHVRFIGNCNIIDKIPDPIRSRFLCIPMYPIDSEEEQDLFEQYKELVSIYLETMNIAYDDNSLESFVKTFFPNMRSILNDIQSMEIQGVKNLSEAKMVKTFSCENLLDAAFSHIDPVELYKSVISEYSTTSMDAMKYISDTFVDYIIERCPQYRPLIEQITMCVARNIAWANESVDKTIFLRAMLCEISELCRNHGK